MDKREREKQRHQEDEALNKLVWWVCGAAALFLLLIVAKRYRVNYVVSETGLAAGVFTAPRS